MSEKQNTNDTNTRQNLEFTKMLTDMQKSGFATMPWMTTDFFERISGLGNEVLQFVAARIMHDVETQHKLLHCKSPHELHEVQSEFVQKAIDQYTAETGKLVAMSAELFSPQGPAKPK
jgi:hypothetical protein